MLLAENSPPRDTTELRQSGPERATTRRWIALAVVIAAVVFLLAQVSPWYYAHGDAPGYISMARNLATGQGLQNNGSAVLWYPPGYAILISPLFCIDRLPIFEIALVQAVLAMAVMRGVYVWGRAFSPDGALWIAAISVGTAAVGYQYRRPLSEMAFMAAAIWAVVCLEGWFAARNRKIAFCYAAAAIALVACCCLIRSLGVALAAGMAAHLCMAAWRGNLKYRYAAMIAAPILAVACMVSVAVIAHDHFAAQALDEETYLSNFDSHRAPSLHGSLWPWFAVVVTEVGRVTMPGMYKSYGDVGVWRDPNMIVYAPLFLALVYGWTRWVRERDDSLAYMLPFYLAILTYFRWESGSRYWAPMTPALMVCAWYMLRPTVQNRQRVLAVVWALHFSAAIIFWQRDLPEARAMNGLWPDVHTIAGHITKDADHVVVAEEIKEYGYLLTLDLDRRTIERPLDTKIVPAKTRWLVLPAGDVPPHAFAERARTAKVALFEAVRY